jgi:hypothetical protein
VKHAVDPEYFEMSPTGVRGRLHNYVRRFVEGIPGGIDEIEQSATVPRSKDESIPCRANRGFAEVCCRDRGKTSSTNGRLWCFHCKPESELAAEIFYYPEAVLPHPVETHLILRVDGLRQDFCAVCDSFSGFGNQGPLLTAGDDPPAVKCGLPKKNPLPKHIAVALPVVGSHAGAQKIAFPLSGKLGGANFAFSQQGKAALTSREVTLANMSQRVS